MMACDLQEDRDESGIIITIRESCNMENTTK